MQSQSGVRKVDVGKAPKVTRLPEERLSPIGVSPERGGVEVDGVFEGAGHRRQGTGLVKPAPDVQESGIDRDGVGIDDPETFVEGLQGLLVFTGRSCDEGEGVAEPGLAGGDAMTPEADGPAQVHEGGHVVSTKMGRPPGSFKCKGMKAGAGRERVGIESAGSLDGGFKVLRRPRSMESADFPNVRPRPVPSGRARAPGPRRPGRGEVGVPGPRLRNHGSETVTLRVRRGRS
jgi:hypothetical protein